MSDETPLSKSEMLDQIASTRTHLESLIAALSEAQMTTPGVQEEWSIKDMLAHIAAWERLTIERLGSAFSGTPLGRKLIQSNRDIDEMNAQVYEANRDRPLSEVLAEFEAAHRDILALVTSLDEAEYSGPIPAEWARGRPVWGMIGGNTCWHYPEHSAAIEQWLKAD